MKKIKIPIVAILLIIVGFLSIFLFQNIKEFYKNKPVTIYTAQPKEENNFVKLIFAGDIMLDRGVRNSVVKNYDGNYDTLFEEVKTMFSEADIAFANFEGTAGDKGKDLGNIYSFRMDPVVIPTLKNIGIDIVSLANNHVGDWGRASFVDTLDRFKENNILYIGGGLNKNTAEEVKIINKNGLKIGFLAFSDVGPNYMVANDNPGVLLASDKRFAEIIQNAKSQVDYLIISFHFGDEYKTIHNKRQEYLAHSAIDNGAKIVIGHHPHVIQDTEIYKNGYIIYSLGNFIFDQKFSTNTMQGLLVELKLKKNGDIFITKNITKQDNTFKIVEIEKGTEEFISYPTFNQEIPTSQ